MQKKQHTLKRSYEFEGKGLHTGRVSRMVINPAPEGAGIKFCRTDRGGSIVEALAENVTSTARSTTIEKDGVSVITIEHLMSALYGLGVDNAFIEIDGDEVPILDGSAKPYVDAIVADGLLEQDAPLEYYELKEELRVTDEESGSEVVFYPASQTSFDVTVDYDSKVLGVQEAHWDQGIDYARERRRCRQCHRHSRASCRPGRTGQDGGLVQNAEAGTQSGRLPEQCGAQVPERMRPSQAIGPYGRSRTRGQEAESACGGREARTQDQHACSKRDEKIDTEITFLI